MNRFVATLAIIGAVRARRRLLMLLTAPILVRGARHFIEQFPRAMSKLQALAGDPSRPWLRTIIGDGMGYAEVGDLVALGAGGPDELPASVWSGRQR